MPSLISLRLLLPLLVTGIVGTSVILSTIDRVPQGAIRLSPSTISTTPGETFSVDIVVASQVPANVFSGSLSFNSSVVTVDSIDYNASIADLWVEEPWYANGDGTITFTGGTTKSGGFTGEAVLLSITFTAETAGDSAITAEELHLLAYDGLGSEIAIAQNLDAVYKVIPEEDTSLAATSRQKQTYVVLEDNEVTDLNSDGKQSILDVSMFMTMLATQNKRADFNQDGKVSTADLSILMAASEK